MKYSWDCISFYYNIINDDEIFITMPQNVYTPIKQNLGTHVIVTKYKAMHPTVVSENYSSSGMRITLTIPNPMH